MGKSSRRATRAANRAGRVRSLVGPSGQLKIVVATSPDSSRSKPSVARDVQLVRAALLYADTVELVSPAALMVGGIAAAAAMQPAALLDSLLTPGALEELGAEDPDATRVTLTKLLQLRGESRSRLRHVLGASAPEFERLMGQFESQLKRAEGDLSVTAAQMYREAGSEELDEAIEAGVVTLSTKAFDLGADTDTQVAQYTETIRLLLQDPSAHLLLDPRISDLAGSLVEAGRATPHHLVLENAGRVHTGTGLASRLPVFPDTSMSNVLEARLELAEALIKYRRAVAALSQRLVSDPLDHPSITAEVDAMWRDEVTPALVDLRRDLKKSRIVRDAALAMGTDAKTVALAFAGPVMATGLTDLSTLASVASGIVPAALKIGSEALKHASTTRDAVRAHDLYYLLDLQRRL